MEHKSSPLHRPFWTPGVLVMLVFMIAGAVAIVARFTGGIGYVTNLTNARPWGLWVGVDVATGVALAAGGFTTAALAHIAGKHYYEPITRPALLTAVLGYTFVVLGLLVDIGRSWAIWKPIFNWNTNSVLFEVAMCVMVYLHVLYFEFFPIVAEQFKGRVNLPGVLSSFNDLTEMILKVGDAVMGKIMWVFIILGVVLSCMHQSSLGSLMLVAPTKLHPLWYTPMLPLLFLTSAFAVGYPMVVFETTLVTASFKLDSEMSILAPLTRITIFLLDIYMFLKLGDMVYRGTYVYLLDGTHQTNSFIVEILLGVMVPWVMLLVDRVRNSRRGLFTAASLIVFGVVLNRVNVFIVGYKPPLSDNGYFPALGEILVTLGLIATLMFIYRFVVTYLPVLQAPKEVSS
ncbi:MAG: Ni/Fe-hydrogenase cytochrome b subunit [Desulfobacter sp.]|nr:Ni/Fe-hydrogenase cytochrome b subunit [Desulfobacter sp.]MDD9303029.1 Ni/Fe-hydrogenase cytochrome b subunit [Desulfobacter sp.]